MKAVATVSPSTQRLAAALNELTQAYRDCAHEEMSRNGDPWIVYRCIKSLMAAESKLRHLNESNWIA